MTEAPILAFREALRILHSKETDGRCGPGGAVAKLMGVSRAAGTKALKRGICPVGWVVTVSMETGIPRSSLRPDVYPASDDPTLRSRPPSASVSPLALERAGQAVIPGTERTRRHV